MKKKLTLLALIAFLSAFSVPPSALGQGTAFTYQGQLIVSNAPANGLFEFQFDLYDKAGGTTPVAGPVLLTGVTVTNGLFTVLVDFGSKISGNGEAWLELGVRPDGGGDPITSLSPRQQLTPTPYAVYAAKSATAATVSGTVPVGQITGTLPLAQLPPAVVTNGASGVNFTGTFSGNGAGVTNLNLTANSGGAIAMAGNFVLASLVGVGPQPKAVTAADVNGDGKPDLITANFGIGIGNTLSVVTNNGSGIFSLAASPVVGTAPQSVAAADVNGDGKADLIAAAGPLTVLTNNGSGGFALSASFGFGAMAVTTADVNGDGKPDLISANYFDETLSVLTNNGSGGFVLAASPGVGSAPQDVTTADVNGDGRPDLISANPVSTALRVLTNNGSSGFVLAASLPVSAPYPQSVVAADVNGDGRPDLISANSGTLFTGGTLTVLTNNGSGFALASSLAVANGVASVTAADVNGDGKPDLISSATVFTNNGSGGFTLGASLATTEFSPVAAADVNGDGKVDLISAIYANSELRVFLNTVAFSGILTGNGSGLTSLPGNVALLNASQTFTEPNSFNAGVTLNPPATLNFGTQTRQMLNLWSTEYALGVQSAAGYFRSGGDFFWYRGGNHTDTNGDAGGGVSLMSLKRSGNLGLGTTSPAYSLDVQSSQAVGRLTSTNTVNGSVLVLQNTTASPTYLGAINFDSASSTPGQIGYLSSDDMAFRVGGAERMRLNSGGLTVNGTFVSASDRNVKEDFAVVDAQEVLAKVAAMPLQSWSYTNRPGVKHIGPMAQDFHAAFGLNGGDDKHIATVDADGVALAAIQGLNRKVEERDAQLATENAALKEELAVLRQLVERLNTQLNGGAR